MPGTRASLVDRIQAKIRVDLLSGCWIWVGATSLKRRGRRPAIQSAGRGSPVISVARYLCAMTHGDAPTPDHEAGHTCPMGEDERCVNPSHLEWMTRTENERHKRSYEVSAVG